LLRILNEAEQRNDNAGKQQQQQRVEWKLTVQCPFLKKDQKILEWV
jgi:hypothetical protein